LDLFVLVVTIPVAIVGHTRCGITYFAYLAFAKEQSWTC
jgi:hypothetical protein